jgi:hypothetical protein
LEEERDPPSYTRSREKKHHQSSSAVATSVALPQVTAIKGDTSSHSQVTLVNPSSQQDSLPPLETDKEKSTPSSQSQDEQEDQEDDTTVFGDADEEEEEELQEAMKEMMDILESEDAEQLENALRNNPQSQDANLSDLDDDLEVQNMLAVTEEEIEFKTMLWMNENHDWLQSQERMFFCGQNTIL